MTNARLGFKNLKSFTARNAGPIRHLEVPYFSRLTMLVGAPGVGKSTLLRSIKQSLDTTSKPPCELLAERPTDWLNNCRVMEKYPIEEYQVQLQKAAIARYGSRVDSVRLYAASDPDGRRIVNGNLHLVDPHHVVPFHSLGDGLQREFDVTISLMHTRTGILLLDGFSDSLRYSAQYEFWKLLSTASRTHNIQVIAVAHSWETIRAFAHAYDARGDEIVLYRIELVNGENIAVPYSMRQLQRAIIEGEEVR